MKIFQFSSTPKMKKEEVTQRTAKGESLLIIDNKVYEFASFTKRHPVPLPPPTRLLPFRELRPEFRRGAVRYCWLTGERTGRAPSTGLGTPLSPRRPAVLPVEFLLKLRHNALIITRTQRCPDVSSLLRSHTRMPSRAHTSINIGLPLG